MSRRSYCLIVFRATEKRHSQSNYLIRASPHHVFVGPPSFSTVSASSFLTVFTEQVKKGGPAGRAVSLLVGSVPSGGVANGLSLPTILEPRKWIEILT